MKVRFFTAVAAILSLISPAWGQIKDAAELFPAHTLAYLELRHPNQLSHELSALVKGSYLEDLPAALAKFREKHDIREDAISPFDDELAAILAFPEGLAEFARFHGGAVALTGFAKNNEPEIVGVLLSGESHMPALLLRVYLVAESRMRIVEEVEGIKIYRERLRGMDERPFGEDRGPAFATVQGSVIVGSTSDSVKDVILRMKGKSSEPALNSKAAFKESAKLREKPGLFGYVDVPGLAAALDETLKDKEADYATEWGMLRTLVNPKAFRYVTASISLHNGNFDCQAQFVLEPGQTSPLVELLPDKKAGAELLHAVPKDTLLAVTAALPEGEKRWIKLLKLADELAKAENVDGEPLPSKLVADTEAKLKCNIGKDVMARINGISLIVHADKESPPNAVPMLVISTDNVIVARLLESTLPKLVGLVNDGEAPEPEKQQINGQTIKIIDDPGILGLSKLCYATHGKNLILGVEPQAVAEALAQSASKEATPADAKLAAAVKDVDDAIVLGFGSLGKTLMLGYRISKDDDDDDLIPLPWGLSVIEMKKPAPEDPFAKELVKVVEPLPLAVISLSRKPDRLILEARQPNLKNVTAKSINIFIDSAVESAGKRKSTPLMPAGPFPGGPPAMPGPFPVGPGPAAPAAPLPNAPPVPPPPIPDPE